MHARAVVLALGGASWSRLGSDGAWVPWLQARDVEVAPLQPSNCGFEVGWSEHLRQRHAGAPLKAVAAEWLDGDQRVRQAGEFVVSDYGVEGSLVYAASAALRRAHRGDGHGHALARPAAAAQRRGGGGRTGAPAWTALAGHAPEVAPRAARRQDGLDA